MITFRPLSFKSNGIINQATAAMIKTSDIGFITKMEKSPFEIVNARRILFSIIGPKTSANTSGAKDNRF